MFGQDKKKSSKPQPPKAPAHHTPGIAGTQENYHENHQLSEVAVVGDEHLGQNATNAENFSNGTHSFAGNYAEGNAQDSACLVGRPLVAVPGHAGHMYIVTGASHIGDRNAAVYSFGKSNELIRRTARGSRNVRGLTGRVDGSGTHDVDQEHWWSLAGWEDASIFATEIPATSAEVESWVEKFRPSHKYNRIGVNSNSAAQAIANRAAGENVRRPRGKQPGYLRYGFPGADDWQRVEFK